MISSRLISSFLAILFINSPEATRVPRSTSPKCEMGTPKAFANLICVYPFNFRKALILLPIRSWFILRCPSFLFLEDHQGDVASSSLHPAIVNVERSLPKGLKQRPVHAFLGEERLTVLF